jgi:hypothetical protein
MFTEKQISIFQSHVDKSNLVGCWNWTASVDRYGYGKVKIAGVVYISHRIAFEISFGDFDKSMHVLHSCDNPKCCNPAHLHLGTHSQNMKEMNSRGRNSYGKGITRKRNKINKQVANQIRIDFKTGVSKHFLAKKYSLSCIHIRSIINMQCWK